MAITLPTPGQTNWDVPLNDALFELQQDITDGANTFVTRVEADNTYARVNDSRISNALQKADNLAALESKSAARVNLGLGNSATKDVGTTSGTVAAGEALPFHVSAADPHGDRAWATGQFIPVTGGTMSGALVIGTGGITLQSGGITVSSGNLTLTGNLIVTGNTSQTGTITSYGFSTATVGFAASIGGDAQDRYRVMSGGLTEWGDGTALRDVNLYRAAADVLATDDNFRVVRSAGSLDGVSVRQTADTQSRWSVDSSGVVLWGSGAAAGDTNLYREGANNLTTDDTFRIYRPATTDNALSIRVTGDTTSRLVIDADGELNWGPGGGGATDTQLSRTAASTLGLNSDFAITSAGKGLKIKEGTNAKMGTSTLVAGTVTVATTAVTANSRIFLTVQTAGGTQGHLRISARTAGTSFTITSTSGTETSTVAWLLVEPA